jgi:hypothetical protein
VSFDLFNLLPAVYRIRDAQIAQSQPLLTPAEKAALAAFQALAPPLASDQQAQLTQLTAKASRGPLQSLLMVIQEQLAIMAEDLDQLYDDQFIETCAPWVIPYIGDLIGYQSVKGIAPAIDNPRSEVAETISLRRRKGTVLVMEQLARDATAWGAHAVEFFRILGDTQYMNHIRLWNHYAPDLRCWKPGLYIDTGFDRTAHKVDVRRIASRRGRYNIQNIGIFLWSMSAYSITQALATPAAPTGGIACFRFSPLGMDIPLFHRAISQGEEITTSAQPSNVADRLRRRVLCDDLQKGVGAVYYGIGNSLAISPNGQFINPYQIEVADLAGAEGSWANMPTASSPYAVVVDPELGRLAVRPSATGSVPTVNVSYYYGFNADMGGGEYPRADTFVVENEASVFPFPDTASTPRYADLQSAVNFAIAQLSQNGQAAVEITASQAYPIPPGPLTLNVNLPAETTLELRAAEGTRPTLLLSGEINVLGGDSSTFCLNGLVIAADAGMSPGSPAPVALVHVPAQAPDGSGNLLTTLKIQHCTLVPGWRVGTDGTPQEPTSPTLIVEASATEVIVENSILGAVQTTLLVNFNATNSSIDSCDRTNVAYSALDSLGPGGPLTLQGCTVVGKVHATMLSLVSDSIFWAAPSKPPCAPVFLSTTPFSSVDFTTPPNAAGDTLVVGTPNLLDPTIQQLLSTVPVPNVTNQQICGGLQLAPGVHVNAYVPTAAERGGDFSSFAATFPDPSPANPFPIVGGVIPPQRFGDTFAWRVSPTPSDPWLAPLWADRKQEGCVRFSFLPIGAQVPRQFQCVDEVLAGPVPIFFTTRYGRPGYLKLLTSTPDVIRRGADDGGEMGAFHFVLGPLRETDLRIRMQEYLPVGLEFGIIYQN